MKIFSVGGSVRDELLGLPCKDYDYVVCIDDMTNKTIEQGWDEMIDFLRNEKFTIFLSNKECFTIRAKFPKGHKFEKLVGDFVLARKETSYRPNTREPVCILGSIKDDCKRRDFTINAMAKDEEGNIIDYFGGQEDLKNKILKTPISGDVTFDDDPLRLLRAIRFAITKELAISIEIDEFIRSFSYTKKFYVVSEERIREELFKCFKHNTLTTLKYLNEYKELRNYIFNNTNLWLKPTNEQ